MAFKTTPISREGYPSNEWPPHRSPLPDRTALSLDSDGEVTPYRLCATVHNQHYFPGLIMLPFFSPP